MFEDATFESEGRIRTRSRRWMIATLLLNTTILLALILVPLIYPEALPRQALAFLLTAPPPPPSQPPVQVQPAHPFHGTSEMPDGTLTAPPSIPRLIPADSGPEQAPGNPLLSMDSGSGLPDGGTGANFVQRRAVVAASPTGPVRLPSSLVAASLIYKLTPTYPAIARVAHVDGTVILQATISKSGTIENLRVISGPAMLQQAAMDAVRMWRYRPYLLNGQPVEVETTINVVFKLGS